MFLLNTLTVPKIKDLVNKPNEQYRDIFATLEKKEVHMQKNNMEDELSSFLQELKQTTKTSSTPAASDFLSANTNEYTPFNV